MVDVFPGVEGVSHSIVVAVEENAVGWGGEWIAGEIL